MMMLVVVSAWIAGCDAAPEQETASYRGLRINTSILGGNPLSELDVTGALHRGVQLEAVHLAGPGNTWISLDTVSAVHGELTGTHEFTEFGGAEFLGAVFSLTFVDEQGEHQESMVVSAFDDTQGTPRYTLRHPGSEAAICANGGSSIVVEDVSVDDESGDVTARPDTLYFGCVADAVGKAVTWGYEPWTVTNRGLQTAIRAIRADYCGDGESWTTPGTTIDVRDLWHINVFDDPSAPNEAVWTPDGALCLDSPRLAENNGEVVCNGDPLPACAAQPELSLVAERLLWTKLAL